MDIGYVSALSALAGSMLGGLASGLFTYLGQRTATRAGTLAQQKQRRLSLYRDFIIAASKAHADAVLHNEPQVPELVDLYAMVSQMRVLSSPGVVACAEEIMNSAGETYFTPNMTLREVHEMLQSGALDPLKRFSELTREELQSLPLF